MDVRGCRDREVEGSSSRFPSSLRDRRVKSTALPRHIGVEGKREEDLLDRSQALQALGPRIVVRSDEDTEVELGYRYGADRDFVQRIRVAPDQDRGVEQERHEHDPLFSEGIHHFAPHPLEIFLQRGVGRQGPEPGKAAAGHPMGPANRPELSHGSPGDGDRQLLTTLGTAQDLTDVVAQLFLGDGCHGTKVAVLLPSLEDRAGAMVGFWGMWSFMASVKVFGEPTSQLDLGAALEVTGLLRKLVDDGIGALVVVHDLALAAAVADRVVAVHDGRTEATGLPTDVFTPERLNRIWGADARVDC